MLITLSTIGIVAALTIPSIIAKNQEKETVVRVKKAFNVLTNAYSLTIIKHGSAENWGWMENGTGLGAKNALDKLVENLNVTKNCGNARGCFPNLNYKNLNNSDSTNYNSSYSHAKAELNDGTILTIYSYNAQCEADLGVKDVCGWAIYDINGFKGPNQFGKDTFAFFATKDSVIPWGTPIDTWAAIDNCKTTSVGSGCTAWVLLRENMDYLHKNVNWEN